MVNTGSMKQTLTLLCIVCPLFLFAQTVNHFENESSKWSVTESYLNNNQQNPNWVDTVTTVYGFQGDTTVNNESWFKTYSSIDITFTTNLQFHGLLRSTNGLVIFQDTTSTIDTLYDFNMELGDSILYDFDYELAYIKVIEVDSIPINGQMFKRMRFSEPLIPTPFANVYEVWIEDIGSVHGPLFPHRPTFTSSEFPGALDLTCSETNFTQFYQNSFYDQCYYSVILNSDQLAKGEFDIYPNPVVDRFFIRQQRSNSGHYLVRDVLGKEVLSGKLQSDNETVDISSFDSGIYFVTVLLDNTTLTKEIIKY